MCLGSFKFWKKRQKDLEEPSTHSRPQLQTNPSLVIPAASVIPVPSVVPAASVASVAPVESTPNVVAELQERLWNQAYNEFKDKESDLVAAYEGLISSKAPYMEDNQQTNTISPQEKWDQMRKTAEEGLQTTERSTEIQGKMHEVFEYAAPIKEIIDRIMPSVPQAQVPWLAVSLTFEIFSKPFKEPGINRTGLLDVISKTQEYMSLSDYLVDDNGLQSDLHRKLEKDTVELYKTLLSYQIKSIYCFHKNELKRFVRNVFKIDDWSSQLDAIKATEALVWEDVNKFQNQVMVDHLRRQSSDAQSSLKALTEMSMGVRRLIRVQEEREIEKDNKECRQHLKQTDPSLDKERILDKKGNLLRESYGWVIDHPQFQTWKTNVHHRRLWIRGDAGKGKTMLLCGIIEELEKDPFHRLCYFFCQATDENLRDGKCVLRGLLFHLIKQYPWLISHVRKDYDDSGEKLFNDHNAWQALRKIFLSVLNDESLDEVTIIVDALDECMIHRDELLKFICDASSGSRAKIIVSSRPLSTIQKALQGDGSNSSMLALELNDDLISDAVKRFIDNRVASLSKTEPFQRDPNICDEITKHLTDNANNTFLWVALVCQELSKGTVERTSHVKAILKKSPPGLDNLYDQMLETIRRESRDFEICIEILAANSVVTRPVAIVELLCILDTKVASGLNVMDLERVIMSCGSFLHVQKGVVYFIHQSAVDFLLKDKSSRLPRITDRHRSVFQNSLRTLQSSPSLERDIYNLEEPGFARKDVKTPNPDPLSMICYSCIHWADHLRDCLLSDGTKGILGPMSSDDVSSVYVFLKTKFLFWIEALSLLQKIPHAIKLIKVLQRMVGGRSSSADQPIKDFIHDANRFLLYHKYVIEEYPLQLYDACLIFSPKNSIVKNYFQSEAPKWVTIAHGLDSTWDACLQTLNGHDNSVIALSCPSDDQCFCSGYKDGTIKLWDTESGRCIHTCGGPSPDILTETPHMFSVDVAFSSDGESFVSSFNGGIVMVWDRLTGNLVSTQRAHQSQASRMAISSDSGTIAYSLPDKTILIWDREKEISTYTLPCSAETFSLALNRDGECLVAVTRQGCMIWNTLNDPCMALSTEYRIHLTVWSTDGLWLATGGDDGSVEVWERQVGHLKSKFKAQTSSKGTPRPSIDHIAISSDGILLAVGHSYDISIWNTVTGALTWALDCAVGISSISFSHDRLRLLQGSYSGAIKIWDLSKSDESRLRHWDTESRLFCWFSTDRFMAYFNGLNEIRIYGKDTPMRLYVGNLQALAISPTGHQLATASYTEKEITIWDTQTGSILRQLGIDTEEASFGYKKSESSQGCEIEGITYDTASIKSNQTRRSPVDLTPDSLAWGTTFQVASSVSGLIKIWDTSDGRCLTTLNDGDTQIFLMVFSKAGRWLATLAYNDVSEIAKIKLWDTVNEKCMTLRPEQLFYTSTLSFSADSLRLAANAKKGGTSLVYVWDVSSGSLVHKLETNDSRSIYRCVYVHFDSSDARVFHTQHGSFETTANMEDAKASIELENTPRGYGLEYDGRDEWIMLDGKRLLWIPEEYRHLDMSSPVIDGYRMVWPRTVRGPVQLLFTTPDRY